MPHPHNHQTPPAKPPPSPDLASTPVSNNKSLLTNQSGADNGELREHSKNTHQGLRCIMCCRPLGVDVDANSSTEYMCTSCIDSSSSDEVTDFIDSKRHASARTCTDKVPIPSTLVLQSLSPAQVQSGESNCREAYTVSMETVKSSTGESSPLNHTWAVEQPSEGGTSAVDCSKPVELPSGSGCSAVDRIRAEEQPGEEDSSTVGRENPVEEVNEEVSSTVDRIRAEEHPGGGDQNTVDTTKAMEHLSGADSSIVGYTAIEHSIRGASQAVNTNVKNASGRGTRAVNLGSTTSCGGNVGVDTALSSTSREGDVTGNATASSAPVSAPSLVYNTQEVEENNGVHSGNDHKNLPASSRNMTAGGNDDCGSSELAALSDDPSVYPCYANAKDAHIRNHLPKRKRTALRSLRRALEAMLSSDCRGKTCSIGTQIEVNEFIATFSPYKNFCKYEHEPWFSKLRDVAPAVADIVCSAKSVSTINVGLQLVYIVARNFDGYALLSSKNIVDAVADKIKNHLDNAVLCRYAMLALGNITYQMEDTPALMSKM